MNGSKFKIEIEMFEDDVNWLFNTYGPNWHTRLEQHIHHEVALRRQDGDDQLRMRKPWDY